MERLNIFEALNVANGTDADNVPELLQGKSLASNTLYER